MSKKLLLFPFGGNAKEAIISILAINRTQREWDILGFIDDNESTWDKDCCGIKVLGGRDMFSRFPEAYILAVPGSPVTYFKRNKLIGDLKIDSSRFANIIHPSVEISPDARIGHNVLIMPNVVISCAVKIGNNCIILPNTVIAHDTVIGDYSCIGSNVTVSGHVVIGTMCYIGSGSKIRDNISIGRRTLVGLGSNVISNIEEDVTVAGNPAKILRKTMP